MNERNNSPLLGFLFLSYAIATLALTLFLSSGSKVLPFNTAAVIKPDFSSIQDIRQRKQAFFDYLLPAVAAQNHYYADIRQQLQSIANKLAAGKNLSVADLELHTRLAAQLRASGNSDSAVLNAELLDRADQIPASMVLSQGAMESAWGTSRFARLANNYFGQWCFSKGCGLVPSQRHKDAQHEVAKFNDINAAVAAYFLNINRHPAYSKVRSIRTKARSEGKPLTGIDMVAGLEKYSARGHAYIEELQSMIRYNKIHKYD